MADPEEPTAICGEQDDKAVCNLPAGHPTGWHQDKRGDTIYSEWRGPGRGPSDDWENDLIHCEGSGCPAHSVRCDYGICSMCGAAVAVHAGRVARAHDRFDAAGLPAPTSREEQ
jgi:hypothetical protein